MKRQLPARILFVDMMSPLGHLDVNHFFVKHVFPHFDDYYYMVDSELYEKMISHYDYSEKPPAIFFPYRHERSTNWISARILLNKKVKFIAKYVRSNDITCIYFLSYDTLSCSFHVNKFRDCSVILMNHDNIARFIKSALRRFVLNRLKRWVHVVYSYPDNETMIERLQQNLQFQKIVLLEHHLDESRSLDMKKSFNPRSIMLYAPSNVNDDKKIINLHNSLVDTVVKVKAKVKESTYSQYRDIYKESLFFGFLDNDVFERDMNYADFILLLYPDEYIFRTSSTLFDAIAYEKPVITDNRFLFETYLEEKGLGLFVDDARAVVKAISQIDKATYSRLVENMRNYKRSYSAEKIGKDLALKIQQIMEN